MKRLTSNIEGLSARQLAQRCIGAEELSNGRERKLALGDDILMSVSSPARYVGGEVNSVMKTLTPGMVRFAMCFPDVYEIGMSHLGIQILYDMFNRYDDVWCERVYSPWLDLDKIMREKKIPLFALESQEPVKNFDFLGITLQYEMCYTNVLQVLDLSGIPLLAKDRTEEDPIVIGGGPCSYNPEPIAEFFDLFYIGEGETAYRKLLDVYKEVKEKGGSRQEFLLRAAREVPGMYVPSLYEVSYKEDGTIASFVPTKEGVPAKITKEIVMCTEQPGKGHGPGQHRREQQLLPETELLSFITADLPLHPLASSSSADRRSQVPYSFRISSSSASRCSYSSWSFR